jgi:two-component system, NarL family, invasion response regulator UvrY
MIKILIADDHPVVRRGLKQILEEHGDMAVTAEAENATETLRKATSGDFDIVLLDISMPDRSGLEILKELKKEKPDLKVLVLSMYPEEDYALVAIRQGASGYLTKGSATEELVSAVTKVCEGHIYVTPALAELLAGGLEKRRCETLPHEKLSPREFQVMRMIASGKSIKQIAGELLINARTASTYRSRVLAKMRLKTNADLIRYAMRNMLVS